MSWIFGNIDFADFDIYVSKSDGLLNLPKLQLDPTDWLDLDGVDYWQEDTAYDNRDIYLSCFMIAKAAGAKSGYEVFQEKLADFYDELKGQGLVTFFTPYNTLDYCSLTEGVQVNRRTNYNADTQVGTFSLRISVQGDSQYLSIPVYDWATFLVKSYLIVNNLVIERQLQGESSASCSYEVKDMPDFHIWDYITVNTNGVSAEPYYFMHQPDVTKVSTNKYSVSVRLEHGSILLKQAILLNVLGEAVFDIYANLDEIVDMIIAGGNRFVGATKFVKGIIETTDPKLHKFSCEKCYDLLKRMASEYQLEYDVRWTTGAIYTVDVKFRIQTDKSITLEYGKGEGLYELSRGTPNRDELVTVLYAYGSNKNLPMDYRGGKDRLEFTGNPLRRNDDVNMAIEKAEVWEDIFPEREGTVTEYVYTAFEDLSAKDQQIFPNGMYRVQDTSLGNAPDHPTLPGFNLNDQLLDGAVAKISMLDGDCAGITFDIQIYEHTPNFYMFIIPYELIKGKLYPNETSPIAAGDKYVFVDIKMPETYITAAETRLFNAATNFIVDKSVLKYPYNAKVHPAFSDAIVGAKFEVGDRVTVIDEDLGLNGYQRISSFRYDVFKRTFDLVLFDTPIFSFRNDVKLEIENMKRIVMSTDADKVTTMRQNQETTLSLKNRMLSPIDEQQNVDQTVRNESIDPRMLSFDAGVPQWYPEGCVIQGSIDGDENRIQITAGKIVIINWPGNTLDRYNISLDRPAYDPTREWTIAELDYTLPTADVYYLYIKLPLLPLESDGTWFFETVYKPVKYYIEDDYLYYHVAIINLAASPRVISALWGNVKPADPDPRGYNGGTPVYLHSEAGIGTYKLASIVEPDSAMETYTAVSNNSTEVLLASFNTVDFPGVVLMKNGAWVFQHWVAVTVNDRCSLVVRVYKRDTGGTETELFNFSQLITANGAALYYKVVLNNQFELSETDVLVFKYYHKCVSSTSRTMYLFIEGIETGEYMWSHIRIPIEPIGKQIQSDWEQTDENAVDFIKNKPAISGIGIEQQEFDFCDIETGIEQIYPLFTKAKFNFVILGLVIKSDATMEDMTIEINGDPVEFGTGVFSVDPTTGIDDFEATWNNVVIEGDAVDLHTSGTDDGAERIHGCIYYQRYESPLSS